MGKWLRALAVLSGFIGSLAKSFNWLGFWPDLTRPTVYTRLSSFDVMAHPPAPEVLRRRLSSRDEWVASQNIPQRLLGRLGDADARGGEDFFGLKSIVANPQSRVSRSQIASIVALARDAESLGQTPRSAGELGQVTLANDGDVARAGHFWDSGDWLEGTKQHASGDAIRLAGNVQAVMTSVDEINIGVAGRTEENGVAGGAAGGGVRGGIGFSQIRFNFNDTSGKKLAAAAADQDRA